MNKLNFLKIFLDNLILVVVCDLVLDVAVEFLPDESSTGDDEQVNCVEFYFDVHGNETLFVEFLLIFLVFACSDSFLGYAFMVLNLPNRVIIFLKPKIKHSFSHNNYPYIRLLLITFHFFNNIQLIRVPFLLFDDKFLIIILIKVNCLVTPLIYAEFGLSTNFSLENQFDILLIS